ncbi:DUF7660 family protein [Burkholderia ambifaria]|jgi:hypothetical protein|uniref:DUF7660 family protein n=1 Tax=Burkholderia ambifaria TaxID=152480 RepID=UPI000D009737|nr:hypothetical protein [Burkholderia ambifaria]MBR8183811.1 hypothetical protein [Burkholderia ambifaria]PRG12314.1 hypothetical protein C6Q14_00545 [Burkholderia ambifaria]QQJ98897.1 hypothetical protein JG536_23020 [Burkholderia ambifaria]
MELSELVSRIESKEELADFVGQLLKDLEENRTEWENPTLERFLLAMESWIRSMDSFYKNTNQEVPVTPNWRTLGDILYAAKIYE